MRTRIAAAFLLALSAFAQPNDEGYTARIRQYTTAPHFLTELVDHLPASDRVPTPEKFLGYIAGAPEKLTYAADIHRYLRALEKATPRVRTVSLGKTEEGRELLLALVSDEANLASLARYREITARLADPRQTAEAEAKRLAAEGVPLYWATGAMHSSETGSPEMLMELAYRLAVEDSLFIREIRKNLIVMITPVLEVDGREKQVDLYRWRKANPNRVPPSLLYWGKYVAHDNNRDGMVLSLAMSRHLMRTFLEYHPQVFHDLHESVPFLYISTGMGPYNAWLDPIVINEWQRLAYNEVEQMTRRGVPGVWTHGFYDGWAANYMFYIANGHNSIGRFYETFGGRGPDTMERTVPEAQTTRTWFRPNPPLPKVTWSHRNNVNLQQSALLFGMSYVARNRQQFLESFYWKSRRSVEKATKEGPAAWAISSHDPRPVEAAGLINLLQKQGVEIHRITSDIEKPVKLPAGSYVVRMDQPYSRMADMMLDRQFYNATDTSPYDDTGWSLGPLRNVGTLRVTDAAILKAAMEPVTGPVRITGKISGQASSPAAYLIPHDTENTLFVLRFRLRNVKILALEAACKTGAGEALAGSFLVPVEGNPSDLHTRLEKAAAELGLTVQALAEVPKVAAHPLAVPRIALVHTWINTQNEGWFRMALDELGVPYSYISDHVLRETADLRARYDVILLGPVGGSSQRIVNGIPRRGDPIPWKKSDLTPNFGTSPDQSDDIRGGMELTGLTNLQRFVEHGGLFITIGGNASIPVDYGLIEGVSITQTRELRAKGSVLNVRVSDRNSPITYGYGDKIAIYFNQSPVFQVSLSGGVGRGSGGDAPRSRPSGRGSATDPDVPQGRPYTAPELKPEVKPGEEPPLTDDMREYLRPYLPPPDQTPRVILRFAEEKDLLVSGMLAGGRELANRPALVDVPRGKGHILLFANNPMWRQQTQGSYFLLFNAMMNFEYLGLGRQTGSTPPAPQPSK